MRTRTPSFRRSSRRGTTARCHQRRGSHFDAQLRCARTCPAAFPSPVSFDADYPRNPISNFLRGSIFCGIGCLAALAFAGSNLFGAKDRLIDLGSRREIFVDHYLIDKLDGVELELQQPRSGGVALRYDGIADSNGSFWTTVIKDGPVYRMYYRGHRPETMPPGESRRYPSLTCYAESPDGIHWTKPVLNLVKVNGSKMNNVILPFSGAFVPFIDTRPGVPASERYKANMEAGGEHVVLDPETSELVLKTDDEEARGLMGFVSADGIRWRPASDKPIAYKDPDLYNHYDSANVMFWSEAEQQYLCFQRHAVGGELRDGGVRATARSTSADFLYWSKPVPMTYSDTGTTRPSQHLYVSNTQPYFRAPHIYIALQARLQEARRALTEEQAATVFFDHPAAANDVSDGVLLTARPGSTHFDFIFRESFVRPGIGYRNWTSRSNYPAIGIVPTGENEMSFYVQRHYTHKSAHLERMVLRLDGFASASAPYDGGELLTKPVTFTGRALEINYATSAAGGIKVEIQDVDGNPIEGFSLEDCPEIIGDEISRIVSWAGGADVAALAGKPLRLRFWMRDADLFSFRFNP